MRRQSILFGVLLAAAAAAAAPAAWGLSFGWGGSYEISPYVSSRTNNDYLLNEARLWAKLDFSPNFNFYLRGRLQDVRLLNNFTNQATSVSTRQTALEMDLAYVTIGAGPFQGRLGRTVFQIGSGAAFNGVADGAAARYLAGPWEFSAFGAYTGWLLKEVNPFNIRDEDFTSGAKRLFFGGEVRCFPLTGMTATLGVLGQTEKIDPAVDRYDSQYFLLGIEHTIAPPLTWSVEGIYQTGKSPITGVQGDIKAYAVLFKTRFLLSDRSLTGFILDTVYASGSANRDSYRPGKLLLTGKDTEFYAFGLYNTGFVFNPEISNLFSTGLSFTTMPFTGGLFERLNLSAKASVYRKVVREGPIATLDAASSDNNLSENALGWALDLAVSWRVLSDVAFACNFGHFTPGPGFVDRTKRSLLQMSLSIYF